MKNLILALLMLPFGVKGQILEVSAKGGICTNYTSAYVKAITTEYSPIVGYSAALSATLGLGKGFRAGLSLSAHKVAYRLRSAWTWNNTTSQYRTAIVGYGNPILPLEALLIKRVKVIRGLSLDIGGIGGIILKRESSLIYEDAGSGFVYDNFKRQWYTYGVLIGVKYNISRAISIGAEVHPKRLVADGQKFTLIPVMAKISFSM